MYRDHITMCNIPANSLDLKQTPATRAFFQFFHEIQVTKLLEVTLRHSMQN